MKNNAKRWIAVGLALVILLASSLTGFKKEKKEELSASYINKLSKQALVDEEVLRGTNAKEKIKVVDLSGVIQSGSNSDFVTKDSIWTKLIKFVCIKNTINVPFEIWLINFILLILNCLESINKLTDSKIQNGLK